MILFTKDSDSDLRKICLLFGVGLIGSAVARHLIDLRYMRAFEVSSSWAGHGLRKSEYDAIFACTEALARGGRAKFHFAWCAGKGSFNSSEEELLVEREAFNDTLQLFSRCFLAHEATFHFTSSAGGLYEGQRLVTRATAPAPSRAYGTMKLAQERVLRSLHKELGVGLNIYRPSSVYGSHDYHRRSGLVSHLMWNALRNQPTTLEGSGHSLRDYVWASDVGAFIARNIDRCEPGEEKIHFMISAKPCSILEVVRNIQRQMGRSISCQFRHDGSNVADITFHHSLLPAGWVPTPLDVALHAVLRETRQSFLLESSAMM